MINELLNSWERRSRCENNVGNAVPRRSRWKQSLSGGIQNRDNISETVEDKAIESYH